MQNIGGSMNNLKLKMNQINPKQLIKSLVFISLGCAIYAFALIHLIVPNEMAEGGGTGVSLILHYAFGISVSTGNILVNVPLLILGYKFLDKKTMIYTLYGIAMLTLWIKFFENYHFVIDIGGDRLLSAVFGGVIAGSGLGMVFVFGGTTGGVDIIAKIFNIYFGISIGRMVQILDFIILACSFIVIKSYPAIMYTLIYIYILTKIVDTLIEGGIAGKGVMIISPKIEEISKFVGSEMERGMTFLKGEGTYTRKEMNIGYCVVSRKEIHKLKSMVYTIDPEAFVTITEVHDVMGEGFSFKQPKRKFGKF